MSELQVIESALQQAAWRCRLARALRGLWHGLLAGALLALLVIGLWHLLPLPVWMLSLAALVPFLCALAGMVITGWRKAALPEVARWVDARQHLKERLSTALEVAGDPDGGTWRDLVVTDAAEHAKELDPRRLVPFRLPKATRWALVVLALGAGLGFVPEYRSKSYLQKKADERNIKESGKQLLELTRRSLQQRPPALEPTQKALEAVTELGDQLTKKAFTRSEALKDLANVAEKLKQELKDLSKDPSLRKMEQAARAAAGKDSQTAAGLQKQMEALQKQMGTPVGNPDALDKLKKDLDKLQEAAKGMASTNSTGSPAERQKLNEALSALSKQMQDAGMQLPQLDDAIKAMAADQPGLVLKDLQAAQLDLEKMRDMAKQLQQLQQQAQKLGKDLAEQLKNGQPEAAQATLQKMIAQLQSASLPTDQLQNILKDVSKAVDPAGNYGKVAEHLKQASKQMQSANNAAAAKSLQAASSELANLMQQMGDAQAMMAALGNVNQASMCIGAGQRWGPGQQQANRPGFNPQPGGPGGGVGTWADENSQWNGQWSDHWDNTGYERPDQDARGDTDRGPGELSDALKPTKVPGQFSPGGPMPSITLKDVSIKGTSKVAYEEAATAAQSDAQSALSQDKVPRAYQGAVKDYFDDLKK
jgi:predicted  nucleic acid-binding Zn-ribbon protein